MNVFTIDVDFFLMLLLLPLFPFYLIFDVAHVLKYTFYMFVSIKFTGKKGDYERIEDEHEEKREEKQRNNQIIDYI